MSFIADGVVVCSHVFLSVFAGITQEVITNFGTMKKALTDGNYHIGKFDAKIPRVTFPNLLCSLTVSPLLEKECWEPSDDVIEWWKERYFKEEEEEVVVEGEEEGGGSPRIRELVGEEEEAAAMEDVAKQIEGNESFGPCALVKYKN